MTSWMVKSHCPTSLGVLSIQLFHLRLDVAASCPQTQWRHLSAIIKVRGLHSEYSGAALATSANITRVSGPACSLTTGSDLLLCFYEQIHAHLSLLCKQSLLSTLAADYWVCPVRWPDDLSIHLLLLQGFFTLLSPLQSKHLSWVSRDLFFFFCHEGSYSKVLPPFAPFSVGRCLGLIHIPWLQ